MKIIRASQPSFVAEIERIMNRGDVLDETVIESVAEIIEDVKKRGDKALIEYTEKFDGISLEPSTLEVDSDEIENAVNSLDPEDIDLLRLSAGRIEKFHKKQSLRSWSYTDEEGVGLGQEIRPLDRVGIYAPGGRALYPSTVLMAAIPAKVAGVGEIILATPSTGGRVHPLILAAAKLGGVERIFRIGGAQAIAALAYGTESVPPVDKIVGPGNVYVAAAKRMVFGKVGIDMIAGPSEILIISDGTSRPDIAAADLLSQAEHDELASAVLVTPSEDFAREVASEVDLQLKVIERSAIAQKSVENYGAVIVTADMDEAVKIANMIAPEHLELMVKNPESVLEKIKNAGAVFMGYYTPEALGDYIAGPNHILPTGGTARFSSPLGVYDFVKRMSVVSFSEKSLRRYGGKTARFADMEGLRAHGQSIVVRLEGKKS
ncbi:MAG: histidinol dehydrogenase [Deltaproteobacteria bacterium]|nr:histidinol dehydrogenase [Deltaproteobacteria bacterium]MBN2846128.1 histidinol dehydrogenase [Deltaproteobacteria bacterium]